MVAPQNDFAGGVDFYVETDILQSDTMATFGEHIISLDVPETWESGTVRGLGIKPNRTTYGGSDAKVSVSFHTRTDIMNKIRARGRNKALYTRFYIVWTDATKKVGEEFMQFDMSVDSQRTGTMQGSPENTLSWEGQIQGEITYGTVA